MENIITVYVVVFKGDDILFVKSGQGSQRVTLPGGRLCEGEDIEQCAVRQVKDICGVDVKLDNRLSGVMARRSKHGDYLVTFIYLADAPLDREPLNGEYISSDGVEYDENISELSRFIIEKLKKSSLSGLDRDEIKGTGERNYIFYF